METTVSHSCLHYNSNFCLSALAVTQLEGSDGPCNLSGLRYLRRLALVFSLEAERMLMSTFHQDLQIKYTEIKSPWQQEDKLLGFCHVFTS